MKKTEYENKIAFFDFDGTLILADSFKNALFTVASPLFIYRLLVILGKNVSKIFKFNLSGLKEIVIEAMFGGMRAADFNAMCTKISSSLNKYDNQDLIKELGRLQENGFEIYIVTASPVNWVKPWAVEHGFCNIIGTELEEIDFVITGKFSSPNCKGDQKVARIKAVMDLSSYTEIIAYGNSRDDYPMLALAHQAFLVTDSGLQPWSPPAQ